MICCYSQVYDVTMWEEPEGSVLTMFLVAVVVVTPHSVTPDTSAVIHIGKLTLFTANTH